MSMRIQEGNKVFNEVVTISSAAGATSLPYSMSDCDEITFVVGIGTAACAATAITPTLNVIQSGDIGLSTNTTVAGATGTIGPTTANEITNAKSVLITISSAATDGETVTINGTTWTASTAGVSTAAATALTFGSSVGATAAGGLDGRVNSLASAINAYNLLSGLTAATVSTVALRVTADDTASTDVNIQTTGTIYALTAEKMQSIISVKAGDIASTSKYVALQISSATTTVQAAIGVIKSGVRHKPPFQVAQTNVKST
ncbi:MAG: hypothetical protein GY782_08435 [Gammaproteobacteria bacterium]|nr:hypothetical protein [Gammaproteobacteria bacterium]